MRHPLLLLACLCPLMAIAQNQPKKEKPLAPGGKWHANDPLRPRPRVVTPPTGQTPPSDATIIFDGKSLAGWKRDPRKSDPAGKDADAALWTVKDGYFECSPKSGSLRTRQKYAGDQQWHIEWATPVEVKGNGQGRGNSGVFIGGFPEIQVLDSYQNDTYPDGQAAGLYGFYPPMVNASRKPGEWQTYDIIVERQKRDSSGKVIKKARLTVIHNGIVVHLGREFDTAAQESDLQLQDHSNPVRYRNIWVRKLNLDDPDAEGTPPPANK
ncbi:MAG: DUF1080 domain-containing protein [Verrucomicrobiaceae bacterium]|nr:DUF1080 domain-containing protein [Verrucomicrobiaceae bacterium]